MSRLVSLALALPLSLAACAEPTAPTQSEAVPLESLAAPKAESPQSEVVASAELQELVRTIEPKRARNGSLRFSDERLVAPAAAPLLLKRLTSGAEDEATKLALLDALPKTQGSYAAEVVELLRNERSETLRVAMVDTLRLARDADAALAGLAIGLQDFSENIRARAAFAVGRRADGLALAEALTGLLSQDSAEVQAAAARALGNLGAKDAFDAVSGLLGSSDAQVRLESLRALGRLDPNRAASLPELGKLALDDDGRVQTAASKVAAKAY